MVRALAVAVGLLMTLGCTDVRGPVSIPADDAEMNRAIERARSEVATFVSRLEKPQAGDSDFAFKAPVTDGDRVEHFWFGNVRHEAGELVGTVGNDPEVVRTVKVGDQRRVPLKEISDWMYVSERRLIGGYTTRVMIQRLPEAQRQAMLASLPFRID